MTEWRCCQRVNQCRICGIGDANGKMMLAHTASAQGITAVENICGRERQVDYLSIPAAAFTHQKLAMWE